MTSNEILKNAVKILDGKKAEQLTAIKVRDLTILAEYFIIASGSSSTQVRAMADEVEFQLGEMGLKPYKVEGYQTASWIVLDYLDVVIHIFQTQTREFYSLERLWSDGEAVDIDALLK